MKRMLLFAFCFFLISTATTAQTVSGSFVHDGLQRNYLVYVPSNYTGNSAVPVVLNFHGFLGNGSQQMSLSNFQPIADTAGFILVCPTGSPLPPLGLNHWNVGGWTNASTTNDLDFVSALIDTVSANYNVNMMRVYATGFSNGGFFSHRLACELGNRIAAIASVSGTFTPQMQTLCAPSHPTPVLQIHGTTDPTVPYNGTTGNGGMASVDSVINYWVAQNNCNNTPSTTALPDISTTDGSTVEHIIYTGGDAGVQVELLKITGGDHSWPGTAGANMDINASLEIWNFFSRYSNTAVGVTDNFISEKNVKVYPNPTDNFIQIETAIDKKMNFKLLSILGKEIINGQINGLQGRIDISTLPAGQYFLKIENTVFKILKTD